MTMCAHSRCEITADGSLRFSHVLAEDAGEYRLQVFKEQGKWMKTLNFLLLVDAGETTHRSDITCLLTATDKPLLKVSFIKKSVRLQQRRLSRLSVAPLTACLHVRLPVCLSVSWSISRKQQRPGPHVDVHLPHPHPHFHRSRCC